MNKATAVLALAVGTTLLLSGCGNILPFGGENTTSIEQRIEKLDGVQNADFTVDVALVSDTERTTNVLTVDIDHGWYITDTAEFADYLVREAWSYQDEPDTGIKVVVNGGVTENFDWYDSLVLNSPTPEYASSVISTYRSGKSVIDIGTAGMQLLYGDSPGTVPEISRDIIQKGGLPFVKPSAALSPKIRATEDTFYFTGVLNDLETEPYIGTVTLTYLNGDVVLGTVEAANRSDNIVDAEFAYVPAEDALEEYTVKIEMTPQEGFNTTTRQYNFVVR